MPTQILPEHAADRDGAREYALQCRMPTDVYEWIRLQRFLTRRSMRSIVREALASYRTEVEAGRLVPEPGRATMAETTTYTIRLSGESYEWLRITAFHTRCSINALLGDALIRFHAAQAEGTPDS